MMFARLVSLIASVASVALAAPFSFIPVPNNVVLWSPDITSPTLLSVWTVGSTQTVTWDPSKVPQTQGNGPGLLLLGYASNGSENLDVQTPLASGFPLADGQVQLTVPNVTERHDYIVVLFGDSGNTSPTFTIKK